MQNISSPQVNPGVTALDIFEPNPNLDTSSKLMGISNVSRRNENGSRNEESRGDPNQTVFREDNSFELWPDKSFQRKAMFSQQQKQSQLP